MKGKNEARHRRARQTRVRISRQQVTRLTVYRSLRHVYAQIVDDAAGKTLVAISDMTKGLEGEFKDLKGQIAVGKKVGMLAARQANEKKISQVVFDRNGYLYHGVVKAIADGAREGGLKL